MEKYEIVTKNKATRGLRFANLVIDLLVFYFVLMILGIILGALSAIFNLDLNFEVLENMNSMADRLLTACLLVVYYFLQEKFFKGRTVGKFITGTKVVIENGDEAAGRDYLMRSLCRIVPFDNLSFFWENGWHDKWTQTRVVKAKFYDFDVQNQIDIESIGVAE